MLHVQRTVALRASHAAHIRTEALLSGYKKPTACRCCMYTCIKVTDVYVSWMLHVHMYQGHDTFTNVYASWMLHVHMYQDRDTFTNVYVS